MSNAGKARGVKTGKRAITGGRRQAANRAVDMAAGFVAAGHNIGDDDVGGDEPMFEPDIDTGLGEPGTTTWSFPPLKR